MAESAGTSRHQRARGGAGEEPSSTIANAFRASVEQFPDHLALDDGSHSLTYRALDDQSNAVADALVRGGGDGPVVVVAPLSITSIAVLLGTLKAGRLVVPLDARWSREQWTSVARRTGGLLVVPDLETKSSLTGPAGTSALIAADLVQGDAPDPQVAVDREGPQLVFFTSGSTGAPKGILVGSDMAFSTIALFDVRADDRVALLAPLSFIAGMFAAIGVVQYGASGHLFDPTARGLTSLPDWLDEQRITILGLSVTLMGALAGLVNQQDRTIESVRFVTQGGEPGSAAHFAAARRAFPNSTFRYAYGMTETGSVCGAEVGSLQPEADGSLPVGRPKASVQIEIVGGDGRPVPDGDAGEIWVTGRDVALGYFDAPALTAERFVTNADGSRTVRTGDRGRFRPDGMLVHLGRMDRKTKINGQLVDLAEVEHEVAQLRGVRTAVVSDVPTEDGSHRIVAHVVIDATPPVTVGELRRGLADRVPPYAIPRAFFRVDDVPSTASGKVDRAWLRESAIGALPLETVYVAPRDGPERAVVMLFEEVLAVDHVGVHDDFFELGGDSLSAIELLAGLSEELDLDLSPGELLDDSTPEALAERVGRGHPTGTRAVVPVNDGTGSPLFCVPGAADTPLQFRPLGRRLPHVALWAFTYRGLDTRALPDQTVAAMARRNVAALREVDPSGPYRLLGYSLGGAVALEMACALTAAGETVELLALLEPPFAHNHGSRIDETRAFAGRVRERAASTFPGHEMSARLARAHALTRAMTTYASRQAYLASAGLVRRRGLDQHDVFFELHRRVLRAHAASPFHGRTVVFASPRFLEHCRERMDRLLPPESAGGQRVDVGVAGEHLDLVREPNVAEVARVLDGLMDGDDDEAAR